MARLIVLLLLVFYCATNSADDAGESVREDKVMKTQYQHQHQQQQRPVSPQQHGGGGGTPAAANRDRGEVSETDYYLLGAIEKMAYRLDFIEKRLRRTEDLLYYVMAGQNTAHNQPGEKADPCPANFTRAAGGCYHFSSEAVPVRRGGGGVLADWKVASAACKDLGSGGALAELETVEETQDIVTHLKAHAHLRDKSYWTGGLNPGLLWIWANSGRPVSSTAATTAAGHKTRLPGKQQEIRGSGRCLLLAYDSAMRGYGLAGADCAAPQHYVCEVEDNSTGRALERIQRNLKLGFAPSNATQHDP